MKNGRCGKHTSGESGGNDDVVVTGRLVGCDQNRVGLPQMDVEGGVRVLYGV